MLKTLESKPRDKANMATPLEVGKIEVVHKVAATVIKLQIIKSLLLQVVAKNKKNQKELAKHSQPKRKLTMYHLRKKDLVDGKMFSNLKKKRL